MSLYSKRSSSVSVGLNRRGIKLMHEQHPPIAHRDIKVENILLSGK